MAYLHQMRREGQRATALAPQAMSVLTEAVVDEVGAGARDPQAVAEHVTADLLRSRMADGTPFPTVMLWHHSSARKGPDRVLRKTAKQVAKSVPRSIPPEEYKFRIAALWTLTVAHMQATQAVGR